jgi:hypothetical protein
MSTFGVCSDVSVAPGGSFYWSNSNPKSVTITPVTPPWPLPQASYTVHATTTSSSITASSNAVPGDSYPVNVKYSDGTSPCPTETNPKIVIQPARKK